MPPPPIDDNEPVLVSACLLGRKCRYDGGQNEDADLRRQLAERGEGALPFCPEEHGGLGTPRPPAWVGPHGTDAVLDGTESVVTEAGHDVTAEFLDGARGALEVCRRHGIRRAYLKERSPSCGVRNTHVAGALVEGPGVTSSLLQRNDIETVGIEGRRG